ncbi:MAG: lipopolysaccharide transport periplasmic protein LptA [Hydrogenothermaceae bacterium]|nr:lipopolysaccharide transport periplasmic protein LptA [Hydrogenothermaceae bacterium]
MVRYTLISIFIVLFLYAQEKSPQKKPPTVITADKVEYYSKEKLVIYRGNVEVNRGDIYLKADSLKIFLDDRSDISKILAMGNVYFKQNNRWGRSNEVEYIKDHDVIIMKGKAEVHQDKNSVEGEIIYYYITEEKAISTGQKDRVRSIFFPKESGDR